VLQENGKRRGFADCGVVQLGIEVPTLITLNLGY